MSERDKAYRYDKQADHYRHMAENLESQQERWSIPKAVPRGQSAAWYRERAQSFRDKAALAHELADLENQAYKQQLLAEMPPEVRDAYVPIMGKIMVDMMVRFFERFPKGMQVEVLAELQAIVNR